MTLAPWRARAMALWPGAAAEVEDALAVDVAEELQRVLARHVGPVGDDVGRAGRGRRGWRRRSAGASLQSAPEREAALVRVVSSNLQHGVPDPVGRAGAAPRRRAAARAGRRRLRVPGARPRALAHPVRSTRAPCWPSALDGELVWARAKRWLWASPGQRARGAGRGGRAARSCRSRGRASAAWRSWRPSSSTASGGRSPRPTCRCEPRVGRRAAARRRSTSLADRPGPQRAASAT